MTVAAIGEFRDIASQAPQAVFSVTGTWIGFVTSDRLYWRPDSVLIGHVVGDDVFTLTGSYVGTMQCGVFARFEERAEMTHPRQLGEVVVPGYPGLPAPSLIRPLQPGETLEAKLIVG